MLSITTILIILFFVFSSMAKVGRLSPSKITTYLGCSMAYFLKYIQHEKIPDNIRLIFGKEIHYLAENRYKKNFKSADTFAGFWKFRWYSTIAGEFLKGKQKEGLLVKKIELKSKNKEEPFILKIGNHTDLYNFDDPAGIFFGYKKLGENILKNFYENSKKMPRPIETEMNFGRKKDDIIELNGHELRGVFDRIDEWDGKMFIGDYKTNKKSPEKNSFDLHRNLQFTIYSYVFRKLFNKKEEAILFHHLRSGDIFETHRSEKDYDYLKLILDKVSKNISNDEFIPFYGFHCDFCDYQTPCEKYTIPYHGGPRIDLEGKIKYAKKFEEWDTELPEWMEMNAV